jgi:cytoskeletal protein CcmA (bactofilin family)
MELAMFDKQRNSKVGQPEAKGNLQESVQGSVTTAADSPNQPTRRVAMIGSGIQVNGDISGDENLVIDGKVEGSIKLDANEVSVGKDGCVKANVSARIVRIDGRVDGDISGQEKVVISKSGNVRGNIKAPRVTLEDGAIFKGSIDMDPGEGLPARAAGAEKNKTNGKSLGGTQPMNLEAASKESALPTENG